MRAATLILLLMLLSASRGAAQPVVGVVVEEATGAPLPGAMVMLFDSTGRRVSRALTNAAGRFLVRARDSGPHQITVERIGYADWTTGPFEPGSGDDLLTIRVPVKAIRLDGLDVKGGRRCEVRPDEGKATARVWEEVRKALAAEEYTREASLYRYTLVNYNRELDRRGRKILRELTTVYENLPQAFRSFPIQDLVNRGFVQVVEDSTIYYAPDAEALLSDAFLGTHCFGLREGKGGDRDRIGLVFRPLEDRKVPEIEGVLWVDAATAELVRLEYDYRNLVRTREVGEAGGEVAFTRLPDGAWIVREWRIRMPDLEHLLNGRLWRMGYTEDAGVTWAITDARGRTILHAETASISGVVTDSAGTGPPPEPVVVELVGTGAQTIPQGDGSFLLTGLSDGRHVVRVVRPLLANWGIASPSTAVAEGRPGEIAHVRLRTPSITDALVAACGGAPRPGGVTAFLGRITRAGGAAAGEMTVVVRWPEATGYSPAAVAAPPGPDGTPTATWIPGRDGSSATATTATDWRGMFLLCDVPAGLRLGVSVYAPAGGAPVSTGTFLIPPAGPAVIENLVARPRVRPGRGRPRQVRPQQS